jgi:hypothetical protein
MKKVFISAAILLSTICAKAAPYTQGDVVFKDELVIINKNIVCSAYSLPLENPDLTNVIYGEYTVVSQDGDKISVSGRLNGDLFSISGTINEMISVSLQESKPGQKASYYFTASGRFSDFTHKGTRVQNVGLSGLLNGRAIKVGCSLR